MEDSEKTPMLYVSYINLTPNLRNLFSNLTHQTIIKSLRKYFPSCNGFFAKKKDYSLGFIVVTKRGVEELEIKGPSTSHKMKVIDYSIFLPEKIENLRPEKPKDVGKYLDLVFLGISLALSKYNVLAVEVEKIRDKCKQDLEIR